MPSSKALIGVGRRLVGSPIQRREWRAYLRYLIARNRWWEASKQVIHSARYGPANGSLPPNLSLGDIQANEDLAGGHDFPIHTGKLSQSAPDRLVLQLAGAEIEDQGAPWLLSFSDPESLYAAHRFGWMLNWLALSPSRDVLRRLGELVIEWERTNPFQPNADGWDSYSISERIVNWIYLASCLRDIPESDARAVMRKSIQAQACALSQRLELRGFATNNHLLNNGRALYFAGAFLGNVTFQQVGREILLYGLKHMFTPSGFLREGSSHYHVLLCRTYLEVFCYAREVGDLEFVTQLRDALTAQLTCADFLFDHASFPLIGDVSPDSPPGFHAGLMAVGSQMLGSETSSKHPDKRGWHSFFGIETSGNSALPQNLTRSRKIKTFADAGYYSVDWSPVKLTVYANPLGYVPAWSHGHADIGGFILEWDGHPLLVDCGRATYAANEFGRYGRSVRSHNAIAIDHYEPCIAHAHNGFVPPILDDYCGAPPEVEIEEQDNAIRIVVRYFGYQRLKSDLTVSRMFTVSDRLVQISDEIMGSSKHEIETFFHLHPQVEVESVESATCTCCVVGLQLSLTAAGDGLAVESLRAHSQGEPAGWFSPHYGVLLPTETLRYHQRTVLPVKNSYSIMPRQD